MVSDAVVQSKQYDLLMGVDNLRQLKAFLSLCFEV
jgi:hypothetical protein